MEFKLLQGNLKPILWIPVNTDYDFVKQWATREEAIATFKERGEAYQIEIIEQDIPKDQDRIGLYHHQQYTDMCRELPLRMAESSSCHRNEASGTLHGQMRVRNFVQDDERNFCAEDQIESEVGLPVEFIGKSTVSYALGILKRA